MLIDTLGVPHVTALEIAHEHEYQIDLYFHIVTRGKHCIYSSKSILDIIHVCEIISYVGSYKFIVTYI